MSDKIIKHLIGSNQIRASFEPSTLNEEDRTVDLVWTTGYKDLRVTESGFRYYEELAVSDEAIDTSRMIGNPLLAVHDKKNLDSVIGVIETVTIDSQKKEGRSKVRFAKDEFSERTFQKVKDKILRNVSVGYKPNKMRDISQKGDTIPTYLAERWTPFEISIVPIGFDPGAQVRNQQNLIEVEFEQRTEADLITSTAVEPQADSKEKERQMTEAEKQALEAAARKQAVLDEKNRQTEIRTAVRDAGFDVKYAEELCSQEISADQARKMIFEKMAETKRTAAVNNTTVSVGTDEKDKKRDAVENALLHRINPDQFQLNDAGREIRGMDLIRIATVLTNNPYGSDSEIANRAMTSSDLPLILANVSEKVVQKSYETAPSTFEQWVNQRTLRNYKQAHQLKVGDFPDLAERTEEGEFTEGYFNEGEELVQLKKFGKILSLSEEMIVNDDMQVLADFLNKAGAAGKRLESKLVYDRLQASTTMKDGYALFDAAHANLGTTGAISETTMDELTQLLKAQKNLDGTDYLDLVAKFLICGPKNETAAKKFLATITPNQSSSVNPFANSVQPIVDPRITSKNWFLVCDKSQIDSIVLYRLLGKEKPQVSTRNKWESGAFQIKVEHSAAAQAMEHKGIVKNPYT